MDNSTQSIEASVVVLESLIDKHSLAYVVEMLARICSEKADHIRASYDDALTARRWDNDSDKLSKLAGRVFN